ncbi:MAG: hypothetical protein ACRDY0_07780 [Acidimicrobiales bacterium]
MDPSDLPVGTVPDRSAPGLEALGRRIREADEDWGAVEEALRRLDDGTYGRCCICGADMEARLAKHPAALECDAHLAADTGWGPGPR